VSALSIAVAFPSMLFPFPLERVAVSMHCCPAPD